MRAEDLQEVTASDPLWINIAMPFEQTFYPLGFPLQLSTNSPLIFEAAEESWPTSARAKFEVAPIRVSLGVTDSAAAIPEPPVFRARGNLMSIISDPLNFVIADMRSGYAFGWIRETTARDRSFFRFYFLDAVTLALVDQLYLAPVHAAAIRRQTKGVLLCGESGTGKSTLAYACARAGWTFVSDDASYLVRGADTPRVIGNSRSLRLRPDAPILFKELLPVDTLMRANGKLGFELATDSLPQPIRAEPQATITDVIFLRRVAGTSSDATLEPLLQRDPRRLYRSVWYGDDEVQEAQRTCYHLLLQSRWWNLTYSNYQQAVEKLNQLAGTPQFRGDR